MQPRRGKSQPINTSRVIMYMAMDAQRKEKETMTENIGRVVRIIGEKAAVELGRTGVCAQCSLEEVTGRQSKYSK